MRIVTVSREFGSGGRELGKRLADELGFAYYDKELITALAENVKLDDNFLNELRQKENVQGVPITQNRTISSSDSARKNVFTYAREHKVIKELALKGDCVIVGRSADALLREYDPFSIFVYADLPSRVARCVERADVDENLSEKELERKIKEIDKARARNYMLVTMQKWGDMHDYSLCVNTTGTEISRLVPFVAECALSWFDRKK